MKCCTEFGWILDQVLEDCQPPPRFLQLEGKIVGLECMNGEEVGVGEEGALNKMQSKLTGEFVSIVMLSVAPLCFSSLLGGDPQPVHKGCMSLKLFYLLPELRSCLNFIHYRSKGATQFNAERAFLLILFYTTKLLISSVFSTPSLPCCCAVGSGGVAAAQTAPPCIVTSSLYTKVTQLWCL